MSYEDIKVHPLKVRDKMYDVFIDHNGGFHSEVKGKGIYAGTRDELYKKMMVATKQAAAKIEVPFDIWQHGYHDRPGFTKSGTATGIHASNYSMLIHWADGKKTQETGLYDALRPLSAEEREELGRLHKETSEANAALRKFTEARKLNVRNAIEKALAKAGQEDS